MYQNDSINKNGNLDLIFNSFLYIDLHKNALYTSTSIFPSLLTISNPILNYNN